MTGFTSDAFGQQVTAGASSYGYDALGRLLTGGTASSPVTLTYSGMGDQVASDPSATYSRDPSGSVTGVDTTAGVKTIALTDQHMDLSGMFTPAGTTLTESSTFDPWGNVIATAGTAVQAGFQGGWTDPATKQVDMGAWFYDPAAGQFLNQDQVTTPAQGDPAAGGDLHAYVNDSPVTGTDPSGHMLTAMVGGGCASAACAAAITRALAPKPAPKPCSGIWGSAVAKNAGQPETPAPAAKPGNSVPAVIFRTGSRTDGALTDPSGVSFRSSVSSSADGQQIFRPGDKIWGVRTDQLPGGSVIMDNNPAGHVSVFASPEQIRNAIMLNGPENPLDEMFKSLEEAGSYRLPK